MTIVLSKMRRPKVASSSPREVAVAAIMREAGCSRELACNTIDWLQSVVANVRHQDYEVHFPSTKALQSERYAVLETVIPHDSTAEPGSAHAAIEALVLDPSRDEFGLRHEMRERTTQRGHQLYCSIVVSLSVMR